MALEPDEILDVDVDADFSVDAALAQLQELARQGKLQLPASKDALPLLALGAAGGILGATFLRGTLGVVIGGGLAFWAYSRLKS